MQDLCPLYLPPVAPLASPCKFLVYLQGPLRVGFSTVDLPPLVYIFGMPPYTITSHDDLLKGINFLLIECQ